VVFKQSKCKNVFSQEQSVFIADRPVFTDSAVPKESTVSRLVDRLHDAGSVQNKPFRLTFGVK
jgi:hypothetical protein